MKYTRYEDYVLSDPGLRKNDDNCLIRYFEPKKGIRYYLIGVFDGVGSSEDSHEASLFIRAALEKWFDENQEVFLNTEFDALLNVFSELAQNIHNRLKAYVKMHGLNAQSTMTLCFVGAKKFMVTHVGDSRCYLLTENGSFRQVTRDQTLAQRERDKGIPDPLDPVERKRRESTILQAMGYGKIVPVMYDGTLTDNFTILLCSDGLSNEIPDSDFKEILLRGETLEGRLRKLDSLARKRGETDNITAVSVERKMVQKPLSVSKETILADTNQMLDDFLVDYKRMAE